MIKYCLHCGEQFETERKIKKFCSDHCRYENKLKQQVEHKTIPVIEPGCDLPVREIVEIMRKFNISYFEYACDREEYIARYRYGD